MTAAEVAALEAEGAALGVATELTPAEVARVEAAVAALARALTEADAMIEAGSLEYAHARLGARFGARPDELAWRRIEMIRDVGGMLDAARASPLSVYLGEIGPDADAHAIELALRAHLRERVRAIAAWMPPDWRAAIEWCALLPDLPVLQHLARGGAPPPWLRDDPLGAALRDGDCAPHRRGTGVAARARAS